MHVHDYACSCWECTRDFSIFDEPSPEVVAKCTRCGEFVYDDDEHARGTCGELIHARCVQQEKEIHP
jgi:hypothetical protein